MNNSRLCKSLINENRRMDAGLITPARVTEITFDANGKPVRRELDPAEYRRERAAEHAARVATVRQKLKLSQAEFSAALGISRRTVENWEQGRCFPTGAARVLLNVAEQHPKILLKAMAA